MTPYKNLGGSSNVKAYGITDDSITVEFGDESLYLYTVQSCGKDNINQMQTLAKNGSGLNSYINKVVKKGYSKKLK
jgi:hypothetical protein